MHASTARSSLVLDFTRICHFTGVVLTFVLVVLGDVVLQCLYNALRHT